MQKSYTTQSHLKKMLSPIQQQRKQDEFFQNQIQSFVHLKSYMPINPIRFPQRRIKKSQNLSSLDDIRQLFQQKQKLRQTLSNGNTLQTSELPEYLGVQTIIDEPEEKPKIETKMSSPSYNHYHNHTKQIVNLMKNAHKQLSPVIGRNTLEKKIIENINFNQLSRLMKAIYNPSKQPKTELQKKRTFSEKISIKQSF